MINFSFDANGFYVMLALYAVRKKEEKWED